MPVPDAPMPLPVPPRLRRHPLARASAAVCAAAVLIAAPAVRAQGTAPGAAEGLPGTWRLHTTLQRTAAVTAFGDTAAWAATSGGVYRVRIGSGAASDEVRAYTTADGLAGLSARAIAADVRRRAVWIGYADGVVDRLDLVTGDVRTLRDIARADRFPQRAVTRLVSLGDTLYATTRFGVVAFDAAALVVRETYSRFGAQPPSSPAFDVARGPAPGAAGSTSGQALFVALDGGVAIGRLDGRNLQDPGNWAVEPLGAAVRSVASVGGRVYAGTTGGVFVRATAAAPGSAGAWTPIAGLPGPARRLVASGPDLIAALAENGAARIAATGTATRTAALAAQDAAVAGSLVVLADSVRGLSLARVGGDGALALDRRIAPPGPAADVFTTLSATTDGTLWATGTPTGIGSGAFRLAPDGDTWANYTQALRPGFPGGATAVSATSDGGAWVGSGGGGLARIDAAGEVTVYSTTNSSLLPSIPSNPPFVIVDGVSATRDGSTVWAANKIASTPLHVRVGTAWTALPLPATGGYSPTFTALSRTFLDAFNHLWISVQSEGDFKINRGLLLYDPGARLAETTDDAIRFFPMGGAEGRGFPASSAGASEVIAAVTEDRRGRLWVGTDKGLAYLPNSSVVARDATSGFVWPTTQPFADGTRGYVLLGLRVRALTIDAADALWVGTDEGLIRIEDRGDGFTETARLTTLNSPLPSNRVTALAVSPLTGHLYVGTEGGLAIYEGAPVPASARPQALSVFPNPLRLGDGDAERVTVRTLVADTDVRILAPDGRLVRRLSGRGGSLDWDARDDRGDLVPSGVYLIVAVGGGGAATGRVAVIR